MQARHPLIWAPKRDESRLGRAPKCDASHLGPEPCRRLGAVGELKKLMEFYKLEIGLVLGRIRCAVLPLGELRVMPNDLQGFFQEIAKPISWKNVSPISSLQNSY